MIRPYIASGATLIISLLIFCQLGLNFAVAVLIAALCCSVLFFFFRSKNKALNTVFICTLSLIMSSSVFITKTVTDYQPAMLLVSDETRTVSGTLYEYEAEYGKYYYTLSDVTVNGNAVSHKIQITTEIFRIADIDDRLTFTDVTIYELGASSNNQSTYRANGIYLGAYTHTDFEVTKAENHSARYYFEEIRQYITESLGISMNPEYAAVADAMLTGNQTSVGDETLLNFRYSGIAHLFAVSGFHLSLWTSALALLLDKIFKKKKYIGNVLCILFVIFFMALTGFTKSVVRAGIMLLILLIGKIIRYQSDPINSLFIAVSVILLINPFAVMSISLQMSVLATLGILILSDPVTAPIYKLKGKIKPKFIYNIILTAYATVMISVIASLFTMPVSALSFGYISVAAPLTNLLCMLPAQFLILLSGLIVLTSKISFIAKPLSLIATITVRYINTVTDKIASLPHSVMDTTSKSVRIILMSVIILMVIFLIAGRKDIKKLRRTLFASAAAVAAVAICTVSVQSSSIKISVADVGNGTSLILSSGENKAIIGCGGSDYKSYKLTNAADRNNSMEYELLLIPRNTKTESEYAYKLLKRYDFENCIVSGDGYPEYVTELLNDDTVFTDNCTVKLDEKTTLVYINSDTFSGLRIVSGNFTCTVLFIPLSDFSQVPEDWQHGSLLVTRQSLPDIDLSGFENIIISSSKEVIYDNSNIYTTKYSGQIDYRMYPSGTATVTEEKHDY